MTNENIPMVYFIAKSSFKDEQPDFIKIGYTYKPLSLRQTAIQTGNEARLWDIGVIPFDTEDDARNKEKEIHSHFDGFRAEGEWFYATTRLMKYIKNNAIQHTELLNRDEIDAKEQEPKINFGNELAEKRNKAGMTQEQLANLVGCTGGYISFLEQKRGIPGKRIYSKLVEIFGEFTEIKTVEKLNKKFTVEINGKTISETRAIDTFITVIIDIGIEKVKDLDIFAIGIPLISDEDYEGKRQRIVEVENITYYIVSGISNKKKKDILKNISDRSDDIDLVVNLNSEK